MKDKINPKGRFDIFILEDGKIVNHSSINNTITDNGKKLLLDFLSGKTNLFLRYLGLGLSNTAASTSQTDLLHELTRVAIESQEVDYDNEQISFHANILPSQAVGKIEELGAFNKLKTTVAGDPTDTLLTGFDEAGWSAGVADTTNFKEGAQSLKVAVNGNTTVSLAKDLDLSAFASTDSINFFVYPYANTNVSGIELRLETDASNYFTESYAGAPTATTWSHKTALISDFSAVGSPSWANINSIKYIVSQSPSAAIDISFDSLRLLRVVTEPIMFSRVVISPAVTKTNTQEAMVVYTVVLS